MAARIVRENPQEPTSRVLACAVVGIDRYVIAFPPGDLEAALNAIGHWAADDRLNFGWDDANLLAAVMKIEADTFTKG